jgi:hemolysin III
VTTVKPRWRGVLHQIAVVVALIAGALLVATTPSARGRLAAGVYVASLTTLFGVSALYHRRHWQPAARAWMRRLDHSAIFVLIAGTYTPFCLLLPQPQRTQLLTAVWIGAGLGLVRAVAWVTAPKILVAVLYLALGWCVIPFLHEMRAAIGTRELWLLAAGGIAYTIGALVYALRRPNPAPAVFGYHEIFHALTLVASAAHFTAVAAVARAM